MQSSSSEARKLRAHEEMPQASARGNGKHAQRVVSDVACDLVGEDFARSGIDRGSPALDLRIPGSGGFWQNVSSTVDRENFTKTRTSVSSTSSRRSCNTTSYGPA